MSTPSLKALRKLGPCLISSVGLGCMNLSHGYGPRLEDEAAGKILMAALEGGCDHFDTAIIYGQGHNESLIGKFLKNYRDSFLLASKCGIFTEDDGKRVIDSHPKRLVGACEESLRRLQTDCIDLYYLHRWDKKVPIEEAVGGLSRLVEAGKIRAIGLSEISASTLRKAHQTYEIAAVQNEYSLWTRNPEIACLDCCRELGICFVAFSPLGRGFLTGRLDENSQFAENDFRVNLPRFEGENYIKNLKLLPALRDIASDIGCTPGQASLAWLINQHPHLVTIPGSRNMIHIEENFAAKDITLEPDQVAALDQAINHNNVAGARYPENLSRDVDSEEFA